MEMKDIIIILLVILDVLGLILYWTKPSVDLDYTLQTTPGNYTLDIGPEATRIIEETQSATLETVRVWIGNNTEGTWQDCAVEDHKIKPGRKYEIITFIDRNYCYMREEIK